MKYLSDAASSRDALTSFYNFEGARKKLEESGFWNHSADRHLALIHIANLHEMVVAYGSAFTMAVLDNISGLLRGFFSKRKVTAVFCRDVYDTFAITLTQISDQECEQYFTELQTRLENEFYGREDNCPLQIRIGIYHIPEDGTDFQKALYRAGAAVDKALAGQASPVVYDFAMHPDGPPYIPSANRPRHLLAEDLTNYNSEIIGFATHTLSGAKDLDSNSDILIQYIGWHLDFDYVLINEFTDERKVKVTNKWSRELGVWRDVDEVVDMDDWDGFLVGFDKRGFNIVPDVQNHLFSERDQLFFREKGIRSFINILFYNHETPIGYLSCSRLTPMKDSNTSLIATMAHLSRIISSYVIIRQISRENTSQIKTLSYDTLTGLYTYAAFRHKVQAALYHYNEKHSYAFVSTDLRNFSHLNENFGYSEGDHILRAFSQKLHTFDANKMISCHMEADHFLLFIEDISKEAILQQVKDLISSFDEYLNKRYAMSDLHIIAGMYYVSNPNKDLLYMIDSTNHARKSIKQSYLENVAVYSHELRAKRKLLLDVVGSVHDAIRDGYIEAFLQPKFSMQRRNIIGAEALVRWRNPDGSYRFPDQFIPILENAGLIVDLDMCVFRQVLAAQKRWQNDGKELIPISVNFSRVHFRDEKFYETVSSLTEEYGIDPKYIEVEVTESTFGENRENLYLQLRQLRERGFLVDIDDFGTGFSSLNMLMSAPVDIVKVDKSFIDHYETKEEQKYINQIGNLILSADKDIIFEGVETEDQIRLLTNYGYDSAQGYFFSKPIPLKEFESKYIYC